MNRTIYCVVALLLCCLTFAQAEVLYETDFTKHYFDDGTFEIGGLTGDGWEAPSKKPMMVNVRHIGGRPKKAASGTAFWQRKEIILWSRAMSR